MLFAGEEHELPQQVGGKQWRGGRCGVLLLRSWKTPCRGLQFAFFPQSPRTAELLRKTLLRIDTHVVGGEPRQSYVPQPIPPEPEMYGCDQAMQIRRVATFLTLAATTVHRASTRT